MEADVSAVADPNTGLAVYDTYGGTSAGATGWIVVGGTSASSPIVASLFAAANLTNVDNSWPYANTSAFNDVTSGSNGQCDVSNECNAGPGYDGPTGIGTPIGSAFTGGSGSTGGSSSGNAGAGGSGNAGAGGSAGGSICAHDICTAGVALDPACDPCATAVCNEDSYCCNTKWNSICVGEVATLCNQSCN
jgi:hypothetical protein